MVHGFQVAFYNDCDFPWQFSWYIAAHALLFFFLFSEFYIRSYIKPNKLKVNTVRSKYRTFKYSLIQTQDWWTRAHSSHIGVLMCLAMFETIAWWDVLNCLLCLFWIPNMLGIKIPTAVAVYFQTSKLCLKNTCILICFSEYKFKVALESWKQISSAADN